MKISKAKLIRQAATMPNTMLRIRVSLLTEDLVHIAAPKRDRVATQVAIIAVRTEVEVISAEIWAIKVDSPRVAAKSQR